MRQNERYRTAQRRRRRRRPAAVRARAFLAGLLAAGGLLLGAGHAFDNGAAAPPAPPAQNQPRETAQPAEALGAVAVLPEPAVSGADQADAWEPAKPESGQAGERQPRAPGLEENGTTGTAVDTADWKLRLVNPWNPLPESYEVRLTQLKNGHAVDERCYPDLQEMMDACRAAGLSPLICSSYRTREKQEALYKNKVNRLIAQGYAQLDAETEAGKSVAVPGTSEHQLGLAVDIVDIANQNLNESQENTAVQKWLMENSWKYGYILRYPNEKSAVTGIIYEPWHYRYVGRDAAEEIHAQGVCLEEYLGVTGV